MSLSFFIGLLTGILNSVFFTMEKIVFNSVNLNDYIMLRLLFSLIIFFVIYLINPKLFDTTENTLFNGKIFTNIKVILLIICISILSILFWLSKNYGFDNFNLSVFTTTFLITSVLVVTLIGVLYFKETLHYYQYIGIVLAIIAVLLINKKK
jgi:drug/metabolite transporter (DMT)-like permease